MKVKEKVLCTFYRLFENICNEYVFSITVQFHKSNMLYMSYFKLLFNLCFAINESAPLYQGRCNVYD